MSEAVGCELPATIERVSRDIYRIAVPTPWMVDVNSYLLVGEPLTLIDTGPGLTASTAALWQALGSIGHPPDTIELLVATHHHFDHVGAMTQLADRAHAETACLDRAVDLMEHYDRFRRQDDDWLAKQMLRHGVAPATVANTRMFAELESHLAGPVKMTTPLSDGSMLHAGGRDLRVYHRPGHSVSDIVLHDEHDGTIFTGDHLLEKVSSNALMSLPLTGGGTDTPRHPALRVYRESLALTQQLPEGHVLPGHGPTFHGHRELISRRFAQQDRRAARFLEQLTDGPRTASSLAADTWGAESDSQVLLVMSEVLGHLDLLEANGVLERRGDTTSQFAIA